MLVSDNEFEELSMPPYQTSTILGVVTTLITTATVVGNLVTLLTMRKCRGLHPSHKFLLTVLSTLSLLIGLLHMSFVSMACFTGRWLGMTPYNTTDNTLHQIINDSAWCKISSYILFPLVKLSICVVTIVSLERFVALKFTYQYYRLTTRKLVGLVCASFLFVIAMTGYEISREQVSVYKIPAYQCMALYKNQEDIAIILYVNIVYKAICHGMVLVVNTYTLVKIILLNRYARYHLGGSKHSERRKLFTVSVLLLTTLDTLTWMPMYLLSIMRNKNSKVLTNLSPETMLTLRKVTWWFLYISPTINPLLYVLRFRDVRHQVREGVRGSVDKISNYGRRLSSSMSNRRLSTSSSRRFSSSRNLPVTKKVSSRPSLNSSRRIYQLDSMKLNNLLTTNSRTFETVVNRVDETEI